MRDLIVIGGGPGGYVAAIRARQLGMDVMLVERDNVGGTCLNRGCIPTKAYYKNAEMLREIKRLEEYSIYGGLGAIEFDINGAYQRKNQIVENLVGGVEKLLKANHIDVIKGTAQIRSSSQVEVDETIYETRRILIATGSEPLLPPIPGIDLEGVVTSTELLEMKAIPGRLAIIGGGVIGMEFACIFSQFGSEVTIIEAQDNILGQLDQELVRRMGVFAKRQGITIHRKTRVERIEKKTEHLMLSCLDPKGEKQIKADCILVSAGRRPCTEGLNLDKLGIVTQHGYIQVDENYCSSSQGIYAIGDVIGGQMLAHLASEEGKVAVERMCGLDTAVSYDAVPACVFTFPEIASVGLSQEEAARRGINYRAGKFQFAANGKAMTLGETDGIVKVIADDEDQIVGIHILGPHASDLILEGTILVQEKMSVEQALRVIHPHPTLGEALQEAIMDVRGQAIHLMPARA